MINYFGLRARTKDECRCDENYNALFKNTLLARVVVERKAHYGHESDQPTVG